MALRDVMSIRQPTQGNCADRDLECELALAPGFQKLVDDAIAAGWTDEEVANALLSVTQDHVHAMRSGAIIDIMPAARPQRRPH